MELQAQLVAARLTGKMLVIAGIGRLNSLDQFQPYGQADILADVVCGEDGKWYVQAKATVEYQHDSPRLITHAGLFIYDQWWIDEIKPNPFSRTMILSEGQKTTFVSQFPFPEIP